MRIQILVVFIFYLNSFNTYCQNNPILIPYKKANLWGFSDTTGKLLIQPAFSKQAFFNGPRCYVEIDSKIGCIDRNGNYLVEPNFDGCKHIKDSYFAVGIGKKCGLINTSYDTILPIIFDNIILAGQIDSNFYLKTTFNKKNGIVKCVDQKITQIIPNDFSSIRIDGYMQEIICITYLKDSIKIFDSEGQLRSSILNKSTQESMSSAQIDEEPILDFVLPEERPRERYPKFETTFNKDKRGLIVTKQYYLDGKYVLDFDTIPEKYDSIVRISYNIGLYPVQIKNKWGVCDANGTEIIKPTFDQIHFKILERLLIKFGSKYILNYFIVKLNSCWGIIELERSDSKSKIKYKYILPPKYQEISLIAYSSSFFLIKKDNLWGCYSIQSKQVAVPIKYSKILDYQRAIETYKVFQIVTNTNEVLFVGPDGTEFFSDQNF